MGWMVIAVALGLVCLWRAVRPRVDPHVPPWARHTVRFRYADCFLFAALLGAYYRLVDHSMWSTTPAPWLAIGVSGLVIGTFARLSPPALPELPELPA